MAATVHSCSTTLAHKVRQKNLNKPSSPTYTGRFIVAQNDTMSAGTLLSLGLITSSLSIHWHYPFHAPGIHGLEGMMLLLLARHLSTHRLAATIMASAAACSYLLQSSLFALPQSIQPALFFLSAGILLDLCIGTREIKRMRHRLGFVSLVGGLIYGVKPAVTTLINSILKLQPSTFTEHADVFTYIGHFAFGAIGATLGTLLATCIRNKLQKIEQ